MWIKFVLFIVFLAVFTAATYQLLQYLSRKNKEEQDLENISDNELIEGAERLSEEFQKDKEM